MKIYKALNTQSYSLREYSLVPLRSEDRYAIMKWRNEQIYHLRQASPLTKEAQDIYFNTIVDSLYDKEKPDQLLFSYLKDGKCIGYGGLVHINWIDKNAEISFIMDTKLEKLEFGHHWQTYLSMIEKVAFVDIKIHKIYTYAFDLRPHLYDALESAGFLREATLEEHCYICDEYKDVVIHSKHNT